MVSTQVGGGVRVVRDWMDCRPLLVNSVVVSKTANAWQQSSPEIAISSRQEVLFNHRFKKHIYGTHTGCVSDRNTHNTQQLVASPTVVSTHSALLCRPRLLGRRRHGDLCNKASWSGIYRGSSVPTPPGYRGGVHVRPAALRARAVALHVT